MEENNSNKKEKLNNSNKKAIIITSISIIAVLVVAISLVSTFLIVRNTTLNNKKTRTVVSTQEYTEEEKNAEDDGVLEQTDEEENVDTEVEETESEEEEKEEEKDEEQLSEEEKKKLEEEKKKREEQKKIQQQQASSNPYWIKVNYSANTVTVYKKDANGAYTIPVKAMVCSAGAATPRSGVYKTPQKARWGVLIGPVWGQYCTRITGQILFHSVPYTKNCDPASLEYWEYDRLGTTRSMGCIRLTVADAKWIFDNCPLGTSVEFYSDPSNPGPWGKPSAPKVSSYGDPYRNWDPTDPNPDNPWHSKKAKEEEERKEAERKKAEEEKLKAEEEAKKAAEQKAIKEAAKRASEEAKNKRTVPNVVGLSEAAAKAKLVAEDLTVEVGYDENATSNDGMVASQETKAGTKVVKNTQITIVVNKVKKITPPANNTTENKPTNESNVSDGNKGKNNATNTVTNNTVKTQNSTGKVAD